MTLGALLALAGIVQTTSSTHGGNQGCPAGTVLIAKYHYSHGYVFDEPSGNEDVVTLTNASAAGATWSSTQAVAAVIVKGGPASTLITFTPPQYSGTFTNTVLPKVGHDDKNYPGISNVQFCGGGSETTTTTGPSTTTSPTTATCQCSTSTSTSTTTSPSTTTTSATTTTTIAEEPATSVAPTTTTTTTTQPAPTTTTTQPKTTTTRSGEEPATSLAPTTTRPATSTTTAGSPTTLEGQGSTTTRPGSVITSTSVLPTGGGNELPFTGGDSMPLVVVGIVMLATGLALTISDVRRRSRT